MKMLNIVTKTLLKTVVITLSNFTFNWSPYIVYGSNTNRPSYNVSDATTGANVSDATTSASVNPQFYRSFNTWDYFVTKFETDTEFKSEKMKLADDSKFEELF